MINWESREQWAHERQHPNSGDPWYSRIEHGFAKYATNKERCLIPSAIVGPPLLLVALVLAALVAPTFGSGAADDRGSSFVYGIGSSSCGTFVNAVNKSGSYAEDDRHAMMSWAQGYLTHYNRVTPNVYDITSSRDAAAIQLWLFNYCQQHPLAQFGTAVDALIIELYATRTERAPR